MTLAAHHQADAPVPVGLQAVALVHSSGRGRATLVRCVRCTTQEYRELLSVAAEEGHTVAVPLSRPVPVAELLRYFPGISSHPAALGAVALGMLPSGGDA